MTFISDALAGRVALITGGATGIGFGIASEFAAAGATVVLASRNLENLETAVDRINRAGGESLPIKVDVRNYNEVEAAVNTARDTYGSLDVVVANAAGNFVVPTAEMTPRAWQVVIDIDLNGTFNCARAAFEALHDSEFGGRLLAISTTRALEGWPGCAHAAAAKAGVMSLMRTLASEWGPYGIRCNPIAPGPIGDTEGVRRIYEGQGRAARELSTVPLGIMFGKVHDIAQAAIYLCSDAGQFVSGADLVVDGGRNRSRAGQAVLATNKEAAE